MSGVDGNKTCFVISPIGEIDSDTRRRSDQVLKYIIAPVAKEFGLDAIRADGLPDGGLVTGQVMQHLIEDAVVVADLSERNPNVFYELGIRHALQKPIIQLIDHQEHPPFDLAPVRTIAVNHRDLDGAEQAKTAIREQMTTALAGDNVHGPVQTAGAVLALKKGGADSQVFSQILTQLQTLSAQISDSSRERHNTTWIVAAMTDSVAYEFAAIEEELAQPLHSESSQALKSRLRSTKELFHLALSDLLPFSTLKAINDRAQALLVDREAERRRQRE